MNTIIDLYELSPMQQGMLFHSLYQPESGLYVEQRCCQIRGVDVKAFKQAWQQVCERHAVLRTAFIWEAAEKPLQIVYQAVELPWIEQDWRSESAPEQLTRWLQHDRQQGFVLNQAPLMRCALLQVADDTYNFVWTHHHLLLDGWCNAILLQEVFAYYEAICQGQSIMLPSPRPYRDYILWLQQQNQTEAEQFWRQTLQGFTSPPPLLSLLGQSHRNSPDTADSSYQEQQLEFSQSATATLQSFAQQHRLTLSTLIQAAWAMLLSRYSQSTDLLFGITVSGRPSDLAGVETMIGLFINSLPVRVKIEPGMPLIDWLRQLQVQQSELMHYSYSALVDIQTWSNLPQGLPLFDSLIVFENYPSSITAALQNHTLPLQITPVPASVPAVQTNYPLTVTVLPGAALTLQISYDNQCFADQVMQRLLGHLQTLLTQMVDKAEQPLSALSLLSDPERQQQWQWNQTRIDAQDSDFNCVHQKIAAQANRTPDAVALVASNQHLTYMELNARANQLADWINQQNVSAPVGLCLERSLEQMIGLLAILKAGAAYIPLDPSYPVERLTWMLEDAQVELVLTQSDILQRLPELQTRQCFLFDVDEQNLHSLANLPLVAANQLAYVIYTSGSTGQPKGVMIPHSALFNYALAACQKFELSPYDRVLQFASIGFDTAAEEIYPTLMTGATLVLRTEAMLQPSVFHQTCANQQITVLDLPTAYWQQLAQNLTRSALSPSLRLTIIGGEAASLDSVLAWRQQTDMRLLNTYGPTETTVVATWWDILAQPSKVAVGKPVDNVQIYVLDQYFHPVPVGVPGELYIGGAGLAQGYFNQPQLTAEKFLPNLFSSYLDQASRLYKTGDCVRYLPDGNLEFLGRLDQQVKLRGVRIEPGEIEAVLEQHPAIQTAIVVLQTAAEPQLVAYYQPAAPYSDSLPSPSDLRQFLSRHLPPQMIPAAFIPLEALPFTSSGKVDRGGLADWSIEVAESRGHSRPASPIEELLIGIWTTILERDSIGIYDSFFELGGHSLRATQVVAKIRQVFDVELPLRVLFEQPTVAQLAQAIRQLQQPEAEMQRAKSPVPLGQTGALPLSYAQQRQWVLAQLEPDSPFYNIAAAVQITGALDLAILEQSFDQILCRHDLLRSGFQTVDGQPLQQIQSLSLNIPLIDISGLPSSVQTEQVQQLADREAKQPFQLDQPPLLRLKLLHLDKSESVLLLTLHHILADGWSIGILLQELTAIYPALQQGQADPLPPLPIQYADFAAWQRSQDQTQQLNYWKTQLQDLAVLELPTDLPRPAVRSLRGATYRFSFSPALTQALQQLSRQMDCTLFMTLLAGFKILLHRYSNTDDIVVGTVIANRSQAELEGLIGFFVNMLALRSNLANNPTVETLLHQVRETALAAYAHQDLPFEQLVDLLQPQRSLSHMPLQAMFVLQNAPMPAAEVAGITWTPLISDSGTAKFDLTLSMQEDKGALTGALEYSLDLYKTATIERMVRHFQTLLEDMVKNTEQQISDLCLLSPDRQQEILELNPRSQRLLTCSIGQMLEAQVKLTPDAIALVYQIEQRGQIDQWSYFELNASTNQLAHYLQSLGVQAGESVGLYFERSPDLIVSMLAILKIGAVYIPLDPDYPSERLAFMLADAQVKRLLTCSKLLKLLPDSSRDILSICLDQDWQYIAGCSSQNPSSQNPAVTSEHLAYIMYTSGSTGKPKGVCIPHRGILRLVQQPNYVDLAGETILQAAPIAFDASTFEIWGALLNGARLVLLPASQPDLEQLGQTIAQHQISTLWLTAGLFQVMVEEQVASFRPLRQLLAGGDLLSIDHVQRLVQAHPHIRLINGYGPTENTTFTCCHTVSGSDFSSDFSSVSLPIGTPISGTDLYILDRYLQPVDIGIPGDIYTAGAGLAHGYLNQPALTAEKFIPNPFAPASRLYQTGDRGRYRQDGSVEYLGRLDQQVKIRGFRVEPDEIAAVLMQHPQVQTAIVVPHSEFGSKRLIAYILLVAEVLKHTVDAANLRAFLQAKLPDYMIPAAFVELDALPLTPNGKIDRRALPTPVFSSFNAAIPVTSTETALHQIWTSVLGRKIGIHDNFFEQGGDSILAIQIVSRANQAGFNITPKQVFQQQTIAELAAAIDRDLARDVTDSPSPAVLAEQGLITGEVPLTPIQHWFFEQILPQPHHYNQAVLLQVKSSLHPAWLEQAVLALLEHHDILRSRYRATETGWQQQIEPQAALLPIWIDLSNLAVLQPLAAVEQQVEQQIEQAAAQLQGSLDLSARLVQVAGFKLGQAGFDRLIFIVHHLVIDSVSWRILLEDLQTAYQHLAQGQPVQLPPKTTAFKQWAERLQAHADSQAVQQAAASWLAGADASASATLPADFPDGQNTVATCEQIRVTLSAQQTQMLLSQVPKVYSARIQELLLTALAQSITAWTGEQSLLIDLESYGRDQPWDDIDLSRTVGWFTTISPVLLTVKGKDFESLQDSLRQIQRQLQAAAQFDLEYGIFRQLSSASAKLPRPAVSFNYLGQFKAEADSILEVMPQPVHAAQSLMQPRAYRLEVNGAVSGGQLHFDWSYSREQYRSATVRQLADRFRAVLLDLVEHCQTFEIDEIDEIGEIDETDPPNGYHSSDLALVDLDPSQMALALGQVTFETGEAAHE